MKEVYLVMRREHFGIDFYDVVYSAHSTEETAKAEAKEIQDWDNRLFVNKPNYSVEYSVQRIQIKQIETPIQKKLNLL